MTRVAEIDTKVRAIDDELVGMEPELATSSFWATQEHLPGEAETARVKCAKLAQRSEKLLKERQQLVLARGEAERLDRLEQQRATADERQRRQARFDGLAEEREQLYVEIEAWLQDWAELVQRRQILGHELDRAAQGLAISAAIPQSAQTTLAIGRRVLFELSRMDPDLAIGIMGTGGAGARPLVNVELRRAAA